MWYHTILKSWLGCNHSILTPIFCAKFKKVSVTNICTYISASTNNAIANKEILFYQSQFCFLIFFKFVIKKKCKGKPQH